MSDYDNLNPSVTLPTNDGIVRNSKEFSDALTLDLTDEEIKKAVETITRVKTKWQRIFREKLDPSSLRTFKDAEDAMKLVDQFSDEIVTKMAEMNLLVTVDSAPVIEGQPPIIELVGALPGHYTEAHGFDHERKEFEVKRSKARGEDFLGSKELDL